MHPRQMNDNCCRPAFEITQFPYFQFQKCMVNSSYSLMDFSYFNPRLKKGFCNRAFINKREKIVGYSNGCGAFAP